MLLVGGGGAENSSLEGAFSLMPSEFHNILIVISNAIINLIFFANIEEKGELSEVRFFPRSPRRRGGVGWVGNGQSD